MKNKNRLPYLWDYDMEEAQFKEILYGRMTRGLLDKKWAMLRIFEYAAYSEIIRLFGYRRIIENWPGLRDHIRSDGRKRGFDFLVAWLPEKHPEKIMA